MMTNFRMNKIIITLLILFSATAYGADVDNALLQKNLEAANTQIEVLKAQVEVMKSYQDNFLTTVYWSLGGVVSIVFILVGYNWFTNFKNQEKEIQLLKDTIAKELKVSKQSLIKEMDDRKNLILESIDTRLAKEITKKTNPIASNINYLSRKIMDNSYTLLKLEYDKWLLTKKVYGNAVTTAVEMISLSMSMKYDYGIEESLEKLIFVLEKGVAEKKKSTIDVNATKEISEVLAKLSDHYESSKLKIQGLITRLNNLE